MPSNQNPPTEDPNVALDTASHNLGEINLAALLAASALLSWEDSQGPDMLSFGGGAFHPQSNFVTHQHFARAILKSDSTFDSPGKVDLPVVLQAFHELDAVANGSLDVLHGIPNMTPLELKSKVIAPKYRHQTELDGRHFFERTLRTFAFLVDIPNRHRHTLRSRLQGEYIDLPAEYEQQFGISIERTLWGALALLRAYMSFTHKHYNTSNEHRALKDARQSNDTSTIQQAFEGFLVSKLPEAQDFEITGAQLRGYMQTLPQTSFQTWLELFSADVQLLRATLQHPLFSQGSVSYQPLPLERYPLVRLPAQHPKPERFIAPNSRSLMKATFALPDTLIRMQWHGTPLLKKYQDLRGIAQEIYLEELVRDLLPDYTCIPETPYRGSQKGKSEVKSADMSLIDPHGQALILVESKAKRFSATEWTQEGNGSFATVDELLTKTIQAADWKIRDLLTGNKRPFDLWATELAGVNPQKTITLVLYGENLPMFRAVWRDMIADPGHALHNSKQVFLPMSYEEFEWFVEIAAETHSSLYDLLMQQHQEFMSAVGMKGEGFVLNHRPSQSYVLRFAEAWKASIP